MTPRPTLTLAAALLAGLALAPRPAAAGKGFVVRQPLLRIAGAGEPDAVGGFVAWHRVRNDRSIVQGILVSFRGISDVENGATLWMAGPEDAEAQEVGSFAVSENGSGFFAVTVDSSRDDGAELPLGAETVLNLSGGWLEVRIPDGGGGDVPVLWAEIGGFHYRDIVLRQVRPGERAGFARLRQPPPPATVVDDAASGITRVWRRRARGSGETAAQGITLLARGLTEDETYEVWMEDGAGVLQEVGSFDSTADGLGLWSLDSRAGDTLPPEVGVDDVRGLRARRIEVRRSGYTDYSLATLLPRVR